MAESCYDKSDDFNSLLLFYSSYGDFQGLKNVSERAEKVGKYNVAFQAAYMVADVDRCLSILLASKRFGEAAYFARAYCPSELSRVTGLWTESLKE